MAVGGYTSCLPTARDLPNCFSGYTSIKFSIINAASPWQLEGIRVASQRPGTRRVDDAELNGGVSAEAIRPQFHQRLACDDRSEEDRLRRSAEIHRRSANVESSCRGHAFQGVCARTSTS